MYRGKTAELTPAFDCVRGTGPAYFKDVCVPVLDIAARISLSSAERGELFLEQERRSSVDGVSRWLLRSSGIHYRLTYDHH